MREGGTRSSPCPCLLGRVYPQNVQLLNQLPKVQIIKRLDYQTSNYQRSRLPWEEGSEGQCLLLDEGRCLSPCCWPVQAKVGVHSTALSNTGRNDPHHQNDVGQGGFLGYEASLTRPTTHGRVTIQAMEFVCTAQNFLYFCQSHSKDRQYFNSYIL